MLCPPTNKGCPPLDFVFMTLNRQLQFLEKTVDKVHRSQLLSKELSPTPESSSRLYEATAYLLYIHIRVYLIIMLSLFRNQCSVFVKIANIIMFMLRILRYATNLIYLCKVHHFSSSPFGAHCSNGLNITIRY